MKRPSDRTNAPWKLLVAAFLALRSLVAGADPADEARAAEELVRKTYFEGLPYEEARAIGPAGAARLVELLADPDAGSHAANVVLALGIAAQPGAFEAIAQTAEVATSGEVDRPTYRLLDAVPIAMGHLARSDARAFEWLRERALARGGDPGWSHGPFRGQRLADQQRRRAIAGLGLSARPEVPALLESIAAGDTSARRSAAASEVDPELGAAIAQALDLQQRIAADGADATLRN